MTTTLNINCANDLEEVRMIAGDWQEFTYNFYTSGCSLVDVTSGSCSVLIFRYGDPSYVVLTLEGTPAGTPINQFTATLPSSSSIDLSGVYQQIPRVAYDSGEIYNPSQGKIVIFPSPSS